MSPSSASLPIITRATKVQCLGAAGFAIALYALSVESHLEDDEYQPMCDLGKGASCTAVFKSSYAHVLSHWGLVPPGHPLDFSLAIAGLLLYGGFYTAGVLWDRVPARGPIFLAVATCGACFSCYLMYVLKFVLKDFCVVCTSFHSVNFAMLILAVCEFRSAQPSGCTRWWRLWLPILVGAAAVGIPPYMQVLRLQL